MEQHRGGKPWPVRLRGGCQSAKKIPARGGAVQRVEMVMTDEEIFERQAETNLQAFALDVARWKEELKDSEEKLSRCREDFWKKLEEQYGIHKLSGICAEDPVLQGGEDVNSVKQEIAGLRRDAQTL